MTDVPVAFDILQPPPGGLARLQHSIDTQRLRSRSAWRSPMALASAAFAVVVAVGMLDYARHATQREFERALHAALTKLPPAGAVVERGIERELPSSRADVRIVVLAQPASMSLAPRQ